MEALTRIKETAVHLPLSLYVVVVEGGLLLLLQTYLCHGALELQRTGKLAFQVSPRGQNCSVVAMSSSPLSHIHSWNKTSDSWCGLLM